MATLKIEKTVEARDAVCCRLVMPGTARKAIFALIRKGQYTTEDFIWSVLLTRRTL